MGCTRGTFSKRPDYQSKGTRVDCGYTTHTNKITPTTLYRGGFSKLPGAPSLISTGLTPYIIYIINRGLLTSVHLRMSAGSWKRVAYPGLHHLQDQAPSLGLQRSPLCGKWCVCMMHIVVCIVECVCV